MPMLSLNPLTAFVKEHEENEDVLNPKRPLGKALYRLIDNSTSTIPDQPGFKFYLDLHDRPISEIYVGMTRAGLRRRINDELKDERVFLSKKSPDELHAIRARIYPETPEYEQHWDRAMRKAGATHIVWVTAAPHLTDEDMRSVEAALIEVSDPKANKQRPSRIPSTNSLQRQEVERVTDQLWLTIDAWDGSC